MVEAGGNRTPVRKPPSQSYPVIRSDKAYAESVFLDDLVSLSAKDCYPELAQNRNVFSAVHSPDENGCKGTHPSTLLRLRSPTGSRVRVS